MLRAACSGAADPQDGPTLIGDASNYRATAALSIPAVETAPAAEHDICWTDATTDRQCHG
jgi:hypothetical protein